jgi:UrcA family protein
LKIRPALFVAVGLGSASQAGAQALTAFIPPPPIGGNIVVTALLPWGGETRAEPVYYGDLDLRTDSGANTLLNRIRTSARRTCNPPSRVPGSFDDRADYDNCFRTAVSQAVADMNIPALRHVYEHRGKGDSPRGRP